MTYTYTVRPLSDHTWLRSPSQRIGSRFSADWGDTEKLLLTEVEHLKGRNLVIEVDLEERHLRNDGTIRKNAPEAASPAVVVAFETPKHGPLLYRCDTFWTPYYGMGPEWQHNARAIAKTLEALRAVDRYGATDTGQQYTGFKALPAGRAMPPSHMTSDEARQVLIDILGEFDGSAARGHTSNQIRRAKIIAHPDRHHGDRTLWDKVEQAAVVLGVR